MGKVNKTASVAIHLVLCSGVIFVVFKSFMWWQVTSKAVFCQLGNWKMVPLDSFTSMWIRNSFFFITCDSCLRTPSSSCFTDTALFRERDHTIPKCRMLGGMLTAQACWRQLPLRSRSHQSPGFLSFHSPIRLRATQHKQSFHVQEAGKELPEPKVCCS